MQAQHEILKVLMHQKDLFEFFKNHEQEEPLILTHDGFVLNGNRRLCAMRELFENDPSNYKHFEHIIVVILPPCDDKDIDELEAKLQIHKDIKADYSWITFALMLKRRRDDHNYDKNRLAELYEIKPSEVTENIDMLAYAEEYLSQRGTPQQYHLVEQNKYAFQQIRKKRNSFKFEIKKEVFEQISYALIDDPEGGRLYAMIPDTATYLDRIIETIQEEIDIPFEFSNTQSNDVEADLLGEVQDLENTEQFNGILALFEDEVSRKIIREVVVDVINGEKRKSLEKKKKNFVLEQIKKANANLAEAINSITDTTLKDGIKEQLDAIQDTVSGLRDWLDG